MDRLTGHRDNAASQPQGNDGNDEHLEQQSASRAGERGHRLPRLTATNAATGPPRLAAPRQEAPPPIAPALPPPQAHTHSTDGIGDGPSPSSRSPRPPPRRVDHTYRDVSNYPMEDLPDAGARARAPTNFPSKLHQILSTPAYCHVSCYHDISFCDWILNTL